MHLLSLDHDHPGVHPVLHERRHPGVRFRLRDLRLVVGEQEFGGSAVKVVLGSEVTDRDRGVLDVPSRPTLSPRTVPCRFPRLLRPPEDKVPGVALPLLDRDAGPGPERLDLLSAQPAPARERRRVVVDASVVREVGVALFHQALNLLDDLGDVVRREGVHVHRGAPEGRHHLEVFAKVLVHDVLPAAPRAPHLVDDPVLDVRDVLQVEDVVSFVTEEPRDDVEPDVRLRVSHVGLVLRREAADEHRHAVSLEGDELLLPSGEAVVHLNGHRGVRMKGRGIKVLEQSGTSPPSSRSFVNAARRFVRSLIEVRNTMPPRPWRDSSPTRVRPRAAPSGPATCSAGLSPSA